MVCCLDFGLFWWSYSQFFLSLLSICGWMCQNCDLYFLSVSLAWGAWKLYMLAGKKKLKLLWWNLCVFAAALRTKQIGLCIAFVKLRIRIKQLIVNLMEFAMWIKKNEPSLIVLWFGNAPGRPCTKISLCSIWWALLMSEWIYEELDGWWLWVESVAPRQENYRELGGAHNGAIDNLCTDTPLLRVRSEFS